jgi:hypothetical protein
MTRISDLEEKQALLEAAMNEKKEKPFKLPFKAKSQIKKANKLPDMIVTQYLTQKKDIRFRACKVISGNIIVINNKVHKINPKHLWRFGKNFWYIHREIDREPVSNEDYDEVREKGRDTDSDVPLIKAVLGAIQKPSGMKAPNFWIIAIIAAIVITALIVFLK